MRTLCFTSEKVRAVYTNFMFSVSLSKRSLVQVQSLPKKSSSVVEHLVQSENTKHKHMILRLKSECYLHHLKQKHKKFIYIYKMSLLCQERVFGFEVYDIFASAVNS